MHFAALSTALLAIVHNALAVPVDSKPALDITLSQAGNTNVKAAVKNTGSEDVTFVHLNFFGDGAPVEKADVYHNDKQLEFQGIRRQYRTEGLTSESLTTLAAGETLEDEFDIASTNDLSKGGAVSLQSNGIVSLVTDGNVSGSIPFSSNKLSMNVNGAEASSVKKAIDNTLDRRTQVASCSGSRESALLQALDNSAALSNMAAQEAASGSASKFREYFATTDSSVRQLVAERFRAVAQESSSTSSGDTAYHCTDNLGYCQPNVLAYTLPSRNYIANCDIYYTALPPLAQRCHGQSQATTTLHEFTHAPGVFQPSTKDLGYGYQAATSLSTQEALNNADNYALYANALNLGC
ncbi:hypothetical protein PHISP_01018 [Aspergillus sp. HF37]|nr:hypothetical protein PHISP_01018 [Aspergillus sp. HF37]